MQFHYFLSMYESHAFALNLSVKGYEYSDNWIYDVQYTLMN